MKKKLISLTMIFIFLIMLSSNCFAQTISGSLEFYTINLPDAFSNERAVHSWVGDITEYSNENKTITIYSFEKEEYEPDLNFNGLYTLNGFTQADLDKTEKEGANWANYSSWDGYIPGTSQVLHKELLTINGFPAQRFAYKTFYYDINYYYDVYAILSDNHLAQIYITWEDDANYLDSAEEKSIINSFRFINDTAKEVSNLPFKDVKAENWYYNAVKYVYKNNIISGLNKTTFGPNDKLTRGMMVTILYRMEGSPDVPSSAPTFADVKDSSKYYYKAVRWAAANNIVSGYNVGKFGPSDNITREQLAIILYKYAKYKGKDVSKTNDLKGFTDAGKVASYALKQVKWAVGAGVITGSNGKLNPKGNATRAEVAAMMEKYCKKVGK